MTVIIFTILYKKQIKIEAQEIFEEFEGIYDQIQAMACNWA